MKNILVISKRFSPDIGGGETNAELLAREFVVCGYSVRVVTETVGDNTDASGNEFPFKVCRNPSVAEYLSHYRWADIVLQNGLCLRATYPWFLYRRPIVVRHLTWISQKGNGRFRSFLKRFVLRFVHSIAISSAVAESLPRPARIIGNPYRHAIFRRMPEIPRDRDVVYLGRLVSDKGVDLLIDAIGNLCDQGLSVSVSIVGDGPELGNLEQLVSCRGIANQVSFLGAIQGDELAKVLNRHSVMAVPSRWNEPFGVVALEGAGCGCVVVGSKGGGLAEAIGPCGITFENGDILALTEILKELLNNPSRMESFRASAPSHLAKHRADRVAEAYLSYMKEACSELE